MPLLRRSKIKIYHFEYIYVTITSLRSTDTRSFVTNINFDIVNKGIKIKTIYNIPSARWVLKIVLNITTVKCYNRQT